jgi:flagellar FliL protein
MLKSKKALLLAIVPILAFGAYTMTKSKPVNKDKIKGTVYVMPQAFLLNLSDGRYAKLTVALELAPGQSDGAAPGAAPASGENAVGTLPEEPVVREIVTNDVTNLSGEQLIGSSGRKAVKRQILQQIEQLTDDKVEAVLFPDLTVQ